MRWTAAVPVAAFVLALSFGSAGLSQPEPPDRIFETAPDAGLADRVLAEKRVDTLPAGLLSWRLDRHATLPEAQASTGSFGLAAADSTGGAWVATLGAASFADAALPPVVASAYLLRVTEVTGPSGARSPVFTQAGSSTVYVLRGELCVRTAGGSTRTRSGQARVAPPGDTPMQASSCGTSELRALVLSVTDASRPATSPARFPAPQVPAAPPRDTPEPYSVH